MVKQELNIGNAINAISKDKTWDCMRAKYKRSRYFFMALYFYYHFPYLIHKTCIKYPAFLKHTRTWLCSFTHASEEMCVMFGQERVYVGQSAAMGADSDLIKLIML